MHDPKGIKSNGGDNASYSLAAWSATRRSRCPDANTRDLTFFLSSCIKSPVRFSQNRAFSIERLQRGG
jgi:hypothetical protein